MMWVFRCDVKVASCFNMILVRDLLCGENTFCILVTWWLALLCHSKEELCMKLDHSPLCVDFQHYVCLCGFCTNAQNVRVSAIIKQ